MNPIADMAREISGLPRRQSVEVQTGSIDGLVSAINRAVGLIPAEKKGVSELSFMGVKVIENKHLLPNTAAIISGGEVVNIIKFDA